MLTDKMVAAILPAADLERAVTFYKETLGLKEEGRMGGCVQLGAGQGTKIFLYDRPGGKAAEQTVAGFNVDDVEQEVRELESKGVTFEDYDMPGLKTINHVATLESSVKTAWFKDSEGNILALNQM